jgi:hypothetical protein
MEEYNEEPLLGSIDNPVKCDGVSGEYDYLENLVTPQGEPIRYYREGSVNRGGGKVLDKYIVQDELGNILITIYFDLYHPKYREKKIVPGLSHVKKFNERQPYQHIDYFFERQHELDPENSLDWSDQFVYIWSKAGMLLSKGAFIYALDDAFGFPIDTMDVKQLKLNCGQIVHELAGGNPIYPLLAVNQKDVKDLLRTFHFNTEKISPVEMEDNLYAAEAEHLMTKEKTILYFRIKL